MLMEHNIPVYNSLENILSTDSKAIVVMGTGVGKTYVTKEYLQNHNYRALLVSPRLSINKAWEKQVKGIQTITYQKFANIYKDIDYTQYDIIVCDEIHHVGAPKWGKSVNYLIKNKIIKVIGLTENSIRYTDGCRDVGSEFFDNNFCIGETVATAIDKKILNPVTYIGAMYNTDGLKDQLRGRIVDKLYAKLNLALNNTPPVKEIVLNNMPSGKRKGIIFASTILEINEAINFVKEIYPNVIIKPVHSEQSNTINENNIEWFNQTEEGYLCSVNMLSEGVHLNGVNTLFMLRKTASPSVFSQQLGRCLSASSTENSILFDLVNNKNNVKISTNKNHIKVPTLFDLSAIRDTISSQQLIIKDYTKDIVSVLEEINNILSVNWSKEEIKILKENYQTKTINDLQNLLPHRTRKAIQNELFKLGFLKQERGDTWTKKEDEIVKKYYNEKGPTEIGKILNRTSASVSARARKLQLINKHLDSWLEEEDQILREYYPFEGTNVYLRLKGRTPISCHARASRLKIHMKRNPWTKQELKILLENYQNKKVCELKELIPNKSVSYIQKKIREIEKKL